MICGKHAPGIGLPEEPNVYEVLRDSSIPNTAENLSAQPNENAEENTEYYDEVLPEFEQPSTENESNQSIRSLLDIEVETPTAFRNAQSQPARLDRPRREIRVPARYLSPEPPSDAPGGPRVNEPEPRTSTPGPSSSQSSQARRNSNTRTEPIRKRPRAVVHISNAALRARPKHT